MPPGAPPVERPVVASGPRHRWKADGRELPAWEQNGQEGSNALFLLSESKKAPRHWYKKIRKPFRGQRRKEETMYIVEGPCTIGNSFGYVGTDVPEGRFAVVEDGEFTNGGYGPSSVDGKLYRTRDAAEAAVRA